MTLRIDVRLLIHAAPAGTIAFGQNQRVHIQRSSSLPHLNPSWSQAKMLYSAASNTTLKETCTARLLCRIDLISLSSGKTVVEIDQKAGGSYPGVCGVTQSFVILVVLKRRSSALDWTEDS